MLKDKYFNQLRFLAALAFLSVLVIAAPAALAQSFLESPQQGSFESGIGLIRGWVCEASAVEVVIDQGTESERRLATAYPSRRQETEGICGDSDNGFGLTVPWYAFGDGLHNLRALADGVEFANVNFVVTTLGGDFLSGLSGDFPLSDFPNSGDTTNIGWSEPHQNFVIKSNVTVPSVPNPPSVARTFLESPQQGSFESGIGLIRGWVCEASTVEVVIDQGTESERRLATTYPSRRQDTQGVCGDSDNGFGLTVPWYAFGNGVHNLRALADGVEFANVNFAVTALGGDFLTGLSGDFTLSDFPNAGNTTTLRWSEPQQNFIIASSTATGEKIATVAAVTDVLNPFAVIASNPGAFSNLFGVRASKAGDGNATQLDSIDWRDLTSGLWLRLILSPEGLPSTYLDSQGIEARFENYTETTVDVSFFNSAGSLIAELLAVPISGQNLSHLQNLVGQLGGINATANGVERTLSQKAFTRHLDSWAAGELKKAANTPSQFSLNPFLLEMIWSSGVAMGETLCALSGSSVLNLVANTGCAAPVVSDFLDLAGVPQGGTDPNFQKLLIPSRADIDNASCTETGDDPTCLSAAAEELANIEDPIQEGSFDLTGDWAGTAQSMILTEFTDCDISLELTFMQTGNQLEGSWVSMVTGCNPLGGGLGSASSGQLSGTVSGNQINFRLVSNDSDSADFAGTIAADGLSMTGTYNASEGDSGSWQVTKNVTP